MCVDSHLWAIRLVGVEVQTQGFLQLTYPNREPKVARPKTLANPTP